MAKVDEIYKKINTVHGNLYTPEQKRAWAHMIELGKHDSISQPPKKRFFQSQGCSNTTSAPLHTHQSAHLLVQVSLKLPHPHQSHHLGVELAFVQNVSTS